MKIPGAFKRLWDKITGVAERTVSKVKEFIAGLFGTGASQKTISERLETEIKDGGPELTDLQQFANKALPGFVTDAIFDAARDTLAARQLKIDALKKLIAEKAIELDSPEIKEIFEDQNIDASAMLQKQVEIPVEPSPKALFLWVAIEDKNTCPICADNHGRTKSFEEWAAIGLPRAGACFGGSYCRCILVPENSLDDQEQAALREFGPISVEK